VKRKEKERERRAERGVWAEAGWAAARSWAPGAAQLGCALFFFVLSFYSFLISYFLYRFCILNPIKVKPLSNFFKKINTMFKTIRKYVFKINADFQ
jgi:hypothetical protein